MNKITKLVCLIVVLLPLLGAAALTVQAQEPEHRHVEIDIMPGKANNVIDINRADIIPVALFGAADFNVRQVLLSTVELGRMHESGAPAIRWNFRDVNRDGYLDILIAFRSNETGLQLGDTEACLHGDLDTGEHFCGHDAVIVVAR